MKLIGLSGTNGSGKDSIGDILAKNHNYLFVSVTDLLRDEAGRRGQPTEREVLRTISAEWRRESGLGVLVDKAIAEYEKRGGDDKFDGLVIASLRNPGEADRVHELSGEVIWIDADAQLRYERIYSRNRADDKKSFKQFLEEEEAEMHSSGDSATLSMAEVKIKSDRILMNESDTLEDLETLVENTLVS